MADHDKPIATSTVRKMPSTSTSTNRSNLPRSQPTTANRLPRRCRKENLVAERIKRRKPKTFLYSLRTLVGCCLIEKPSIALRKLRTWTADSFARVPLRYKGTPGKRLPAQTLKQYRGNVKPLLQHVPAPPPTVGQILDVLRHALELTVPLSVSMMSIQVAIEVIKHKLLRGYSSRAVARGCMEFAATALHVKLEFSRSKSTFTKGYLKVDDFAVQSVYNALWLNRDKFAAILVRHGASSTALKLPSGPFRSKIIKSDATRTAPILDSTGVQPELKTWVYTSAPTCPSKLRTVRHPPSDVELDIMDLQRRIVCLLIERTSEDQLGARSNTSVW